VIERLPLVLRDPITYQTLLHRSLPCRSTS
jgi:hypothetical protein